MNILKFLFFVILLAASLYYAYTPWFHPKEYLGHVKKKRIQSPKDNIFVLIQTSSANYLGKHHGSDIWLARMTSLLLVIIFLVALMAQMIGQ